MVLVVSIGNPAVDPVDYQGRRTAIHGMHAVIFEDMDGNKLRQNATTCPCNQPLGLRQTSAGNCSTTTGPGHTTKNFVVGGDGVLPETGTVVISRRSGKTYANELGTKDIFVDQDRRGHPPRCEVSHRP